MENNTLEVIKRVEGVDVFTSQDKEDLKKFLKDLRAQGVGMRRLNKYICCFKRVKKKEWLESSFKEATADELKSAVINLDDSSYAEWTKKDTKVCLKRLYKWYNGGEDYPKKIKWLKTTMKNQNKKLPEDLFTDSEIKEIISKADNPRDACMVALLWDSGMRPHELLDLRIKDCILTERGYYKVKIRSGKSPDRVLPLREASPYLKTYLNNHPRKDQPDANLWYSLASNKKDDEGISRRALANVLKRLVKLAGINKDSNPYQVRHSRATYLAKRLTDAELKTWLGHKQTSTVTAKYIHMSNRDLEDASAKAVGEKTKEEKEKSDLAPKECPRCHEVNRADASYCDKCTYPLTEKAKRYYSKNLSEGMKDFLYPKILERLKEDLVEVDPKTRIKK